MCWGDKQEPRPTLANIRSFQTIEHKFFFARIALDKSCLKSALEKARLPSLSFFFSGLSGTPKPKKEKKIELDPSEETRRWYTVLSCCVQRANARGSG